MLQIWAFCFGPQRALPLLPEAAQRYRLEGRGFSFFTTEGATNSTDSFYCVRHFLDALVVSVHK
jgi:hypothetical protein